MALVRWNPRKYAVPQRGVFGDFDSVLDNLFDWSANPTASDCCDWTPRVDVVEEKDKYVAQVDLPGLKKDDIEVTMENDVLTISGERKLEKTDDDTVHRRERFSGKFTRSMSFPGDVDAEKIEAGFTDGVLRLTIPKSEVSKARAIEIK
jgi:HSP20 family protein